MADLTKYELTFCQQTKDLVVALQNSLEKKDFEECLHKLHTLKGSAAMMECKGLENFARKAEELIKSNKSIEQLKSACQEIKNIADDFKKLKNYKR